MNVMIIPEKSKETCPALLLAFPLVPYFLFWLVVFAGNSLTQGKKSRPCMYGCNTLGILKPSGV